MSGGENVSKILDREVDRIHEQGSVICAVGSMPAGGAFPWTWSDDEPYMTVRDLATSVVHVVGRNDISSYQIPNPV
jgi:hypothetical protein